MNKATKLDGYFEMLLYNDQVSRAKLSPNKCFVYFILISYTALDILKDNRLEKGGKTRHGCLKSREESLEKLPLRVIIKRMEMQIHIFSNIRLGTSSVGAVTSASL